MIAHTAHLCHEALRALPAGFPGEPAAPAWDDLDQAQQESVADMVELVLLGADTPEELHDASAELYRLAGWSYGARYDEGMRTHPCLVPYALLPAASRTQIDVFLAIVKAADQHP